MNCECGTEAQFDELILANSTKIETITNGIMTSNKIFVCGECLMEALRLAGKD